MRAAPLLLLCLVAAPAALALDTGDILVVSARGQVRVTMNGAVKAVRAGSVLELPASVSTGADGSIELRQGATTVSVGPDTLLDFPALERRGGPIDRIQQPRGNAFYSIGKREGRKLRVETPYLVGVVKGTQFNVSAGEGATTISLFEGRLEVRAADESSLVDLKAGEIASRRRGDNSINVIRMDAGKPPITAPRSQAGIDGNGASNGNGNGSGSGRDGAATDRHDANGGSSAGVVVAISDPLNRPGVAGSSVVDVRAPPRRRLFNGRAASFSGLDQSAKAPSLSAVDRHRLAIGQHLGANPDFVLGAAHDAPPKPERVQTTRAVSIRREKRILSFAAA